MTLKFDGEFQSLIPLLSTEELKQLEDNLLKEGWRENEAIVSWNGFIVDGHNRFTLCKKHGIEFVEAKKEFKDKTEAMVWIIDNQLGRRNISVFVRIKLALKKAEFLKPMAEEKQRESGGAVPQKSAKPPIDIRDNVAKIAKTSHDTVSKVKYLLENADKETIDKLEYGNKETSINQAYNNVKKRKKREEIEESFKEEELEQISSEKKYSIIYADPPWKYFAGGNKNASGHYHCMEMEEIKNLPIEDLAKDNCILFMWTTFPVLKESFEVIEAWGFRYATCGFVWVKQTKNKNGWHFGCGNWTRANAEVCLIAIKGKPLRKSASVSQIIDSPVEGHSKKPDIVRDKIVELCGDLPRIELFARQKTKGWDNWGNEVKK